jgi:phage-related protein
MSSGLPAFLQGLATGIGGTGQAITAILTVVSNLIGPLGNLIGIVAQSMGPVFAALVPVVDNLIGVLADALAPILTDLAPIIGDLVIALVQDLTPIIAALAPVVDVLLKAFAQMMPVILPLVQLIAGLLAQAFRGLLPVLMPLIPVIMQLLQVIVKILMDAFGPLGPLIDTITAAFVQLIPQLMPLINLLLQLLQALEPFIGIILRLAGTILQVLIPVMATLIGWWARLSAYIDGPVVSAVTGLLGTFTSIGQGINTAVKNVVGWISGHWDDMIKTISGLPGRMAAVAGHLWDWFGAGLKTVINDVVIDSMNWVIAQINSLTSSLSDVWSWAGVPSIGTISPISHLASGGTTLTGGLAVVGEQGPELVNLPAQATVTSSRDTRGMLDALRGTSTPDMFYAEMTVRYPDGQTLDKVMVEFQRRGGVSQAIETGARRALAGR